MAQPEHVPVIDRDRVRVTERLPTPEPWVANRPGDVKPTGRQPSGPRFGVTGPDQGYALHLAHLMEGDLKLAPREHIEDALAGCVELAMKRAALFGRAPVKPDVQVALGLWGYLDDAPPDLIAFRRPLFAGASDHYNDRRTIVDRVTESTLRLTPAEVRSRLSDWRSLVGADPASGGGG